MPKPTWFNLAPDKRTRVLDAAMREFGTRGFSGGSLNTIAREAGVSKGSLFQYFDGKLELFAYVCDECSARVRREMVALIEARGEDEPLFSFLRAVVLDWIAYFEAHPLERGVTFATNFEVDPAARAAVRDVVNRHYTDVLRPLLKRAQDRGELRSAADGEQLLGLLVLLLPHLALARHAPELDPVFGLHGATREELAATINGLVGGLERAFGPDSRAPGGRTPAGGRG